MPTSQNQKMKLLYLAELLHNRTDEEHGITVKEIIDALIDVGIKAERKSIYTDIEALKRFGLDIEQTRARANGYYLASREFELPELKLLVDAVQSSHFITQKKSNELIAKLSSLASDHQAKHLKRQVFVTDKPKSINESIYYNVDAIHTAINAGRKIDFKYFDYGLDKQRSYRKSGSNYTETPLALCWDDEKYYLVCYSLKYDGLVHYRVDRMSNVEVSQEKAEKIDRKRFDLSLHIKQVFGMYAGKAVRTRLRFDNSLINIVLDRFGTSLKLMPSEKEVDLGSASAGFASEEPTGAEHTGAEPAGAEPAGAEPISAGFASDDTCSRTGENDDIDGRAGESDDIDGRAVKSGDTGGRAGQSDGFQNGSFEVDIEVLDSPVFLSWIVQFGNKAEIVAPESLRNEMWELTSTVSAMYQQ